MSRREWENVKVNGVKKEIYFFSNLALGLWAVQTQFEDSLEDVTITNGSADKNIDTMKNQNTSDGSVLVSEGGRSCHWRKEMNYMTLLK